jgi:hypothetical protein
MERIHNTSMSQVTFVLMVFSQLCCVLGDIDKAHGTNRRTARSGGGEGGITEGMGWGKDLFIW